MYKGCWNFRTMYSVGKKAKVAREMENYNIEIHVLGLSQLDISMIRIQSGQHISGRGDGIHSERIAIMTSSTTLIEWKPVSERIIPVNKTKTPLKIHQALSCTSIRTNTQYI